MIGAIWNQRGFAAVMILIWLLALLSAVRPLEILISVALVGLLTWLVAAVGIHASLRATSTSRGAGVNDCHTVSFERLSDPACSRLSRITLVVGFFVQPARLHAQARCGTTHVGPMAKLPLVELGAFVRNSRRSVDIHSCGQAVGLIDLLRHRVAVDLAHGGTI